MLSGMTAYYEIRGHISSSGDYFCGFDTFLCSQLPSRPFVLFSLHLVIPHCSLLDANQTAALSLSTFPHQMASRACTFFNFYFIYLSVYLPACLSVFLFANLSVCVHARVHVHVRACGCVSVSMCMCAWCVVLESSAHI